MKIIMLGHKRIPSREGGVEIVVEELASRMAMLGHDVTVYNRKGHHVSGAENEQMDYQKKYEYRGVHVRTVFTLEKKSLNAVVYSFFATLRASLAKADVIHFHAEGPCSMLPIAKLSGKKCVATIHGLDWQRAKWGGFATKFLLFGERMAAKYADEVIVLSQGVQKYFKDTYGRDTLLIPNGITKPEFREAKEICSRLALKTEQYILFLARLVPEKGVHTLLEAYEKSNLTIPLVIAGGGSHASEYEEEIKAKIDEINAEGMKFGENGKKVVQTGFVQGRVLEELYSNAALYVLPSEIEGMPLSLLEAMSYGNICLTSDITENTSVTEQKGFAFENKSVSSLQRQLEKTIENKSNLRKQQEFSRGAIQQFILNKYNWDEVVEKTLECYENTNCK